ncbi:MAG: hypothetical protein ROZ00_11195 [Denitratisoma sp.]|nr:hypothetical protein [Denitratisoma sp.]
MKRVLKLCAPVLMALSGCSTLSDLPPGYRLGATDTEGLAIVSLTLSGRDIAAVSSFVYRARESAGDKMEQAIRRPYFDSPRQHARSVQNKNAQDSAMTSARLIVKEPASNEPLDVIESGRAVGRVAVLRLPAGNYELYDWKLVVPNQYGGNEFRPNQALAYRFTIEAGRAIYLGNLDLHITERDAYKIVVENKAARDLPLLARKLPSISVKDMIYRPIAMQSIQPK